MSGGWESLALSWRGCCRAIDRRIRWWGARWRWPGGDFESGEPCQRGLRGITTHLAGGLQLAADRRARCQPEKSATQRVVELDTRYARWFSKRHAGNGRADGRRDATGAATGAAGGHGDRSGKRAILFRGQRDQPKFSLVPAGKQAEPTNGSRAVNCRL